MQLNEKSKRKKKGGGIVISYNTFKFTDKIFKKTGNEIFLLVNSSVNNDNYVTNKITDIIFLDVFDYFY
jgi:hypothetical protein